MNRLTQQFFSLVMAGAMAVSLSACGSRLTPTEDAYRSIKVYQTAGEAVIEREKVGKMDAFKNLKLISGDLGEVFVDSNMRLELDDDKYILIEEQSRLRIQAEGNDDTSKTRIELLEGAVTCEIENKLSEDSTFEVSTPNSIMAVRGTTFRIAYLFDQVRGNGETIVQTLGGTVTTTPTDHKGIPTADSRDITGGQQVSVVDVEQPSAPTDSAPDDSNQTVGETVIGQFKTEENEDFDLGSTSFDSISFVLNEDNHRSHNHHSSGNSDHSGGHSVPVPAGKLAESSSESVADNSVDGSSVASDEEQIASQKKKVGDTVFSVEDLLKARETMQQQEIQEKQQENSKPEEHKSEPPKQIQQKSKPINNPEKPDQTTRPAEPQPKPTQPSQPLIPIQPIHPVTPEEPDQPTNPDTTNPGGSGGDQSHHDNNNDDHNDDNDDDHSDDNDDDHNDDDDHSGGGKPQPVMYILTCMMGSTKLTDTELPENGLIPEPAHPDESNAGHWALEPSGTAVTFNEDFRIHSDMTLYWVVDSPVQYTVRFKNEENTFCTQIVLQGETVQEPHLQPTKDGYWEKEGESSEFDFASTVIGADTTLNWKAETETP